MQSVYLFVLLCLLLVLSLALAAGRDKNEGVEIKMGGTTKPPPPAAKSEFEARGVVLLDDISFYKIVPSDRRTTVMLVWNKRQLGEYGTESYRADYYDFVKQSYEQGCSEDILFTQLIVNGAQNAAFSQRELGVKKDFMKPVVFLFKPNDSNPIKKDFGSMNPTDMTKWISQNTLFYFEGVKGIIQDGQTRLAHRFMKTADANERAVIMAESAKQIEEVASHPTDKHMSEVYLKVMEAVIERGDDYITAEIQNINELVGPNTRISNRAIADLKIRRAVLRQFTKEEIAAADAAATVGIKSSTDEAHKEL